MELYLLDFLNSTLSFCKEDLFVVASHYVTSHHGLWLANYFQTLVVQTSLDDAVIKLHDQHVLHVATKPLCDQLACLDFVAVEPSA